jgi:hypothetical protein
MSSSEQLFTSTCNLHASSYRLIRLLVRFMRPKVQRVSIDCSTLTHYEIGAPAVVDQSERLHEIRCVCCRSESVAAYGCQYNVDMYDNVMEGWIGWPYTCRRAASLECCLWQH